MSKKVLKKYLKKSIGMLFILAGLFLFFLKPLGNLTGFAIAGIVENISSSLGIWMYALGLVLMIVGGVIMAGEESLETIARDNSWHVYPITNEGIIEDLMLKYLKNPKEKTAKKRTPMQERIERSVTLGRLIDDDQLNQRDSYEEQFYEGHSSKGGRAIEVKSHVKDKRLIHFGEPANGEYIWIVNEDGEFIVANRKEFLHDMKQMPNHPFHPRETRLPHSTISKGKSIYGAGDLILKDGLVETYNTASGHYIDLKDVRGFNKQGREVFEYFLKKFGLGEKEGGAEYKIKHQVS